MACGSLRAVAFTAAMVAGLAAGGQARAEDDHAARLDALRAQAGVPGMALAVIGAEGIATLVVSGERRAGSGDPIGPDDPWHIGSDGKAMAAAMIARLVERGLLRWDQTLPELFPDLTVHETLRSARLIDLLGHRAGVARNPTGREMAIGHRADLPPRDLRTQMAARVLGEAAEFPPGSAFAYSNAGYVLAGAAAERAAGAPFETLMQREIFEPLGMTGAGFGAPAAGPMGHRPGWFGFGSPVPVDPAAGPADNPAFMAPAGTMHMRLQDWAAFLSDMLKGASGEGALLTPESYTRLLTPLAPDDEAPYALGWGVAQGRGWAMGPVYMHAGSNTMWFAQAALAPGRGVAIVAVANSGSDGAAKATGEAIRLAVETLAPAE